jgi:hypothetical protein
MAHFLIEQGVDPTQSTKFLSDGGETVRIAKWLNPIVTAFLGRSLK